MQNIIQALSKIRVIKILLGKNIFSVNINWGTVLAFVTFCSYSFYGTILCGYYKIGSLIYHLESLILYLIFLTFLVFMSKIKEYQDKVLIQHKDILVFTSYFSIMFLFSFESLIYSLYDDQLYHAQISQYHHAIGLIFKLSGFTSIIDNQVFSSLIYVVNLLTLGLFIFIYYFIRNRNRITKIVIFSLSFFLLRLFFRYSEQHPPFRLFPLWVSSSILPCTDFTFRLPQFLALIILMWSVQRIAHKKLSFINSWFLGLIAGTIPVLWHVGTVVEPSIWTALAWTILALSIALHNPDEPFKLVRWFSIISICVLMRQSAIGGLVPLFLVLFFSYMKKQNNFNVKNLFTFTAPILILLPFFLKSIIFGTPTTYTIGEATSIQRILMAITSEVAPKAIIDHVMLPWIAFLFFAFVPFNLKKLLNAFLIMVFFLSGFCIFYSTAPYSWGNGRYQAEYVIPFVILGSCYFMIKLNEFHTNVSKFLPIIFAIFIAFNVHTFTNLHIVSRKSIKNPWTGKFQWPVILSSNIFNFRDAFREVKQSGFAGSTFVAGQTYGIFGEILNGFTVAEVKETQEILKNITWGLDDVDLKIKEIQGNDKIKLVLIPSEKTLKELISKLKAVPGWEEWKEFKNKYNRTVVGIVRK